MNEIHSVDLDLNLLKVFDAVMETRSVSRAAERLGLGQPAVSHGLARLRRLTGDPLFVRTAGRMEPTARAQRLAEPLREALLLAVRALRPDLPDRFDPARGRHVFTLGAGDYAGTVLVGRLLDEIAVAGWDIGIAVLHVDRRAAPDLLDAGRIDLALGLLPETRRWHERALLFEEQQACLFDGARLGIAAPVSLDDYARLPALVPSLGAEFESWVDEELEAMGRRRRSILATSHFLSIPLLLKRVAAIATLPQRLCQDCANAAALTVSALPLPARRFEVSLLWHRRDSAAAPHRWLRERLVALNRDGGG